MSVVIRPRAEKDIPALAQVLVRVYEQDGYPVEGVADPTGWLRSERMLAAFTAELDGRPVGHVMLTIPGDGDEVAMLLSRRRKLSSEHIAVLGRLFVDPESRGQGLASKLMRQAVASAQDADRHPVLDVMRKDIGAIALYRREGWMQVGSFEHEFPNGSEPALALVFPVPLSEQQVEWLALVRYQLLLAQQQLDLPAPANSVALNTIQDAVESLLNLVAQSIGAPLKSKADFSQVFDGVMATLSSPDSLVAFRPSIISLNSARVSFKNHGNLAAAGIIARHVSRGNEFCIELTREALQQDLEFASLLSFVKNDEGKKFLVEAVAHRERHELVSAAGELRKAFDQLVRDYTQSKRYHSGRSYYSTKPTFFGTNRAGIFSGESDETKWLEEIDQRLKIVSLGIDMTEYIYFIGHTPVVHWVISGDPIVAIEEGFSVSEGDFERCWKFVMDSALCFPKAILNMTLTLHVSLTLKPAAGPDDALVRTFLTDSRRLRRT